MHCITVKSGQRASNMKPLFWMMTSNGKLKKEEEQVPCLIRLCPTTLIHPRQFIFEIHFSKEELKIAIHLRKTSVQSLYICQK
jgi:hypothetical protein